MFSKLYRPWRDSINRFASGRLHVSFRECFSWTRENSVSTCLTKPPPPPLRPSWSIVFRQYVILEPESDETLDLTVDDDHARCNIVLVGTPMSSSQMAQLTAYSQKYQVGYRWWDSLEVTPATARRQIRLALIRHRIVSAARGSLQVRIVYFDEALTADDVSVMSRLGFSQYFAEPLLDIPHIKLSGEGTGWAAPLVGRRSTTSRSVCCCHRIRREELARLLPCFFVPCRLSNTSAALRPFAAPAL